MKQQLLNELENPKAQLFRALSLFKERDFNIVPFEGSWTAGQVMQHIVLSASSVKVLRGPVKKSNRKPDEHVSKLESVFLNFNTKMNAPDFIVPESKNYDLSELQASFNSLAGQLEQIIKTSDLTEICLNAPPVLGELTRLELIRFINFHTKRHTHQLEKIKRFLENSQDD